MHICPICGFGGLDKPVETKGVPSFDICPCCGFEFGFHDGVRGETYEKWRMRWIQDGMKFRKGHIIPPPVDWDPRRQLASIGITVSK